MLAIVLALTGRATTLVVAYKTRQTNRIPPSSQYPEKKRELESPDACVGPSKGGKVKIPMHLGSRVFPGGGIKGAVPPVGWTGGALANFSL